MKKRRLEKNRQSKVLPPTPRQIDTLRYNLKTTVFIEFAGVLAGISPNTILEWFKRAIEGDAEYMPILDMYREETAILAKGVMEPIWRKAFEDKDLDALKFIYNNRIKRFESRFLDKLERIEDAVDKSRSDGYSFALTDEQLEEAEARQIAKTN